MEMRQLRYFVAAADHGSFTKAAEHCQVSQPSLSQQIAKLEHELGQPVFERLSRSVMLTDTGRLLLVQARQILALTDEVQEQIDAAIADGKGRIVIAAIPTVAPYLLPKILQQFRRDCPQAVVEVQEITTENCLKMCATGEVDLALVALPIEGEDYHLEPLMQDELFVALPAKHRLAKKKKIALSDLEAESFILLDEAHCLTGNVLSFCQQKDLKPIVNCRSSQLQTVQNLIELGHGISLIPAMAAQGKSNKSLAYRPIVGQPTRTIALLWHRHRFQSQITKQMVKTITACCKS